MDQERLVPVVLSSWKPSQWEDSMQPAENNIWVMQECDSKRILAAQRGMHFSKHPTVVRCCKSRVLSPICSNSLRYKNINMIIQQYQAWKLGDGPVTDLGKKIVAALAVHYRLLSSEVGSEFWLFGFRFQIVYSIQTNRTNRTQFWRWAAIHQAIASCIATCLDRNFEREQSENRITAMDCSKLFVT